MTDIIHDFFETYVQHRFAGGKVHRYVIDVYVDSQERTWIVDFNVWGKRTDSLLFDWTDLMEIGERVKKLKKKNGDEEEEVLAIPMPEFRVVTKDMKDLTYDPLSSFRGPTDVMNLMGGGGGSSNDDGGFEVSSFKQFMDQCVRPSEITSSELNDSLFDDIFESEPSNRRDVEQEPPKNYNEDAAPFSELESDQDRARRMEMVRELQKVYYNHKEPNSSSDSSSYSSSSTASSSSAAAPSLSSSVQSTPPPHTLSYGYTTLRNLPTITSHDGIKTADTEAILPGFQFVWNIHNPQHCHMFHSILSGPAPWYFAHVFLPRSSTSSSTSRAVAESSTQEETPTINNIESYNDIQSQLKSSQGLYGTLLRITDRRFHDEDGRIVLAVQAMEKIRIHSVSSKPGTSPYLCTDVQLAPDDELMRLYFDKALMSSASFLSSSHDDLNINDDGGENNDENDDSHNPLSSPSAVSGAARAAAVADSLRCRKFECLPVFLEEKPKRPNNIEGALEAKSTDSNATKKIKDALRMKQEEEKAEAYMSIVQLMNYDGFAHGSLDDVESVTTQALGTYWKNLARETKAAQTPSAEEDLFSEIADSSSSLFLPEPSSSIISSTPSSTSVEAVEMMEFYLWRSLDKMIRLLSMVSAATVPLPSQLLGLLPMRDDWPKDFLLEGAATSLDRSGSNVGIRSRVHLCVSIR
ncbi:hypothetical protein ACHAXM_004757 [Skeletonema potamos]